MFALVQHASMHSCLNVLLYFHEYNESQISKVRGYCLKHNHTTVMTGTLHVCSSVVHNMHNFSLFASVIALTLKERLGLFIMYLRKNARVLLWFWLNSRLNMQNDARYAVKALKNRLGG